MIAILKKERMQTEGKFFQDINSTIQSKSIVLGFFSSLQFIQIYYVCLEQNRRPAMRSLLTIYMYMMTRLWTISFSKECHLEEKSTTTN